MTDNKVLVFDVYGTLFDVHSITTTCEKYFPGCGEAISKLWREKQIQYTFLRQAMGKYQPFSSVTRDALQFAAAFYNQQLTPAIEADLLEAYKSLELYPESKQVLETLKDNQYTLLVFSNGSKDMLEPLLRQAGVEKDMDYVLSVDDVKQYKPSPAAYHLILDTIECRRDHITFLSSNGWDISGAKAFGFTTAWINRSGQPVEGLQLPPDDTYASLSPLIDW
ncbi:haloacid dehalogenase type II [Salibacterium salarium]|uniref:Haloacid dehalogenase type II n=1 Tax=Salibacterium salarium TaxID=284579 RepID=A0A428N0J6_9BACI|nr:haloacid dehalogenase type II [Salibacterium salarium]RSL31951.1 haloacid dehalogenase type II [Salibacterium salarium]